MIFIVQVPYYRTWCANMAAKSNQNFMIEFMLFFSSVNQMSSGSSLVISISSFPLPHFNTLVQSVSSALSDFHTLEIIRYWESKEKRDVGLSPLYARS